MMTVDVLEDVIDLIDSIDDLDPRVDFARPGIGWFVLLDGALAKLAVLALNRTAYEKVRDFVPLPERSHLRALLLAAVGVHVAEAAVACTLARRRGLPACKWASQTLIVGFPSLLALRRVSRTG